MYTYIDIYIYIYMHYCVLHSICIIGSTEEPLAVGREDQLLVAACCLACDTRLRNSQVLRGFP